jgi:hypothetical protein
MITFLARAARAAREERGRKPYHVAAQLDGDPSTVYRFEKGRWPRDADAIIDAYAQDLDIEPIEIWLRAVQMWRDEQNSEPTPLDPTAGLAEELVDGVAGEHRRARGRSAGGSSPREGAKPGSPRTPGAPPRKRRSA